MIFRAIERFLLDEKKILIVILLNAAVLFALCFSQLPLTWRRPLDHLDDLFTVVFLIECMVKIRAMGWRGYLASSWHKFDFVLVTLAVPSLLLQVGGVDAHSNMLLAIRVGRAFKFFRSLRFVPGIDSMLMGIQRALRASVLLFAGFAIGMFMISVLSCRLFGVIDPEHYGDPILSLYSTFKIFTVEGWFEIPDHVASQLEGLPRVLTQMFFSGVLLICGILGLSLVNSVFVDAMVADNNDALESKVDAMRSELAELRALLLRANAEKPINGEEEPR